MKNRGTGVRHSCAAQPRACSRTWSRARRLDWAPRRALACVLASLAAAALLCAGSAAAQKQNTIPPGPGWQVMRADWGAGNPWMDVTYRVRMMLSENGMARVTNQNLGGDAAVDADKILRIFARNSRRQSSEFTFSEGGYIDASQFYNYGGGGGPGYPGNPPPRPPNPGIPANPSNPGGGYGNFHIVRAYYGWNNQTNDVTQHLRRMAHNGSLSLRVTNGNLGGDPAVGRDKVLTVIYRFNGREQTSTVKEGSTLSIP